MRITGSPQPRRKPRSFPGPADAVTLVTDDQFRVSGIVKHLVPLNASKRVGINQTVPGRRAADKALRTAVKGTIPETPLKRYTGLPLTLGNAAAARVRLAVWCKDCRHQVEPDAAAMAERYGAEMSVPDWRERRRCSQCGSSNVDMMVTGTKRR
jgi:hypothetical protein